MRHTIFELAAVAAIAVTGIDHAQNNVTLGHSLAPVDLVLGRG